MKSNLPSGLNQRTFPLNLSAATFWRLVSQGVVVDGRAGGLILGRTYEEGGVTVVSQRGTDFFIHSQVEGGEFVLNRAASAEHISRLKVMNVGFTLNEDVAPTTGLPAVSHFILTDAEPNDRLLWLHWNQVAVMAAATEKHLTELVAMNAENNPFMRCDFEELFPSALGGTEDGVV